MGAIGKLAHIAHIDWNREVTTSFALASNLARTLRIHDATALASNLRRTFPEGINLGSFTGIGIFSEYGIRDYLDLTT